MFRRANSSNNGGMYLAEMQKMKWEGGWRGFFRVGGGKTSSGVNRWGRGGGGGGPNRKPGESPKVIRNGAEVKFFG